MLISRVQPMRGWLYDFISQKQFFWFMFPLLLLFGWPIENLESFRDNTNLGWQRYARIVLFIGFFFYYLLEITRKSRFRLPASAPVVLFLIYGVYAGISAVYSPEPLQTAWKAFELIVVLLFGLRLYEGYQMRPMNAVADTNAIAYIAFTLCLMSIVGGFVAPEHAWLDFGMQGIGARSMAGVAPSVNPNTLGQLGSIVFLVGFARLLSSDTSHRLGSTILVLVGLATLFLAYSRTSIVATLVVAVLLMFLMRKFSLVVLSVPIVAILSLLFADSFLVYLARGQSTEQFTSLSGRTYMWEAALEGWRSSPWFGHGFFVGHKYVQLGYRGFLETTDNTYVETLVNLGIVGFSLISLFAFSAVLLARNTLSLALRADRKLFSSSVVLMSFVVVIVIRSLTASSFQVLHYNLVFFMVSIMALTSIRNGIRKYPRQLGTNTPSVAIDYVGGKAAAVAKR